MAEPVASLVPVDQVGSIWHLLRGYVQDVLDRSFGEMWLEDVWQRCNSGEWQVWIATDDKGLQAMALTELVDYPRARLMVCQMAGGRESAAVCAIWPIAQRWAAENGCKGVRFMARKGWARGQKLPAGHRILQDCVTFNLGAAA